MKYDLHSHTKYSHCSNTEPHLILKAAEKKLNGIAITDHNTIQGALHVKKLNKDKDFEVIIGEEIKTDKGEILAYYLNTEIKPDKFDIVMDKIKQQGAIASVAHPFAILRLKSKLTLKDYQKINAIETLNARAFFKSENIKAKNLSLKLNLAQTAGSDSHHPLEIGRAYTIFENNLEKAIKTKTTKVEGTNKYSIFCKFLSLPPKINNLLKKI